MPKETVYGSGSLPAGEDGDLARAVVEVRWDREAGHVMLATKLISRADHETYVADQVRATVEGAGLATTRSSHPVGSSRPLVWLAEDGYHVEMDRRGLNDLIRKLRRARDAAFGKDE